VGGIQIAFSGYVCTQGFNAQRVMDGMSIFVTNSHCTTTQFTWEGTTLYQNTVAAGNAVGHEVSDRALYACVAGVASCRMSDAAYIRHNGTRAVGAAARGDVGRPGKRLHHHLLQPPRRHRGGPGRAVQPLSPGLRVLRKKCVSALVR
jgi:hypothetical protein